MTMRGYEDYKSREFCRDVCCPVQLELNTLEKGSAEYEKTRQACKAGCKYTAWQFHHWLMDEGYLVVRPEK